MVKQQAEVIERYKGAAGLVTVPLAWNHPVVIPGRAVRREPEIHNHRL